MIYAVVDRSTGAVLQTVETATLEALLNNCPPGHDPHPVGDLDLATPSDWWWNGSQLTRKVKPSETIEEANARIIRGVKAEADRRKLAVVTPLPFKTAEYAGKAAEVAAWDAALGAGIIGTVTQTLAAIDKWSAARRSATFPWALADAKAYGDTLDKAIARFRAGMAAPAVSPYDIAGREAVTCTAVRNAKTIAAKEAAAAAAVWPV